MSDIAPSSMTVIHWRIKLKYSSILLQSLDRSAVGVLQES